MNLPSPFFYRVVQTPSNAFPPYATSNDIPRLGSWTTKVVGTTYQAASDGFLVFQGVGGDTSGAPRNFYIFSDMNNPPTTLRANASFSYSWHKGSLMSPVRKGDYFRGVADIALGTLYWIPLSP